MVIFATISDRERERGSDHMTFIVEHSMLPKMVVQAGDNNNASVVFSPCHDLSHSLLITVP